MSPSLLFNLFLIHDPPQTSLSIILFYLHFIELPSGVYFTSFSSFDVIFEVLNLFQVLSG